MLAASTKTAFTAEERAHAAALLASLQTFLGDNTAMPAQYVMTFLRVVADEGKSVSDYATSAGISKAVMTRHLLDIGERARDHTEGMGLVYQKRDIHDLRINRTYATPQGRTMFLRMMNALRTVTGRRMGGGSSDTIAVF
jgi:DNA-binding MarR family transcriptional regulator